jgi:hypothetical protein
VSAGRDNADATRVGRVVGSAAVGGGPDLMFGGIRELDERRTSRIDNEALRCSIDETLRR